MRRLEKLMKDRLTLTRKGGMGEYKIEEGLEMKVRMGEDKI